MWWGTLGRLWEAQGGWWGIIDSHWGIIGRCRPGLTGILDQEIIGDQLALVGIFFVHLQDYSNKYFVPKVCFFLGNPS